MLIPIAIIQIITIIYSLIVLVGAFFIAYTAHKWGKDNDILRARVFLSEEFLKDNWSLLILIFFLNAVLPLNEPAKILIEDSVSELIKSMIQLGIIIGIVILEYKWYKLVDPGRKS